MPIRVSGLQSGLDTESIISALVSAYDYKKEKYVKAQTKLTWTQEAWQSLNTKIYSLYSDIGSLRYDSSYQMKKTTVSDTTKASVTASGAAINGVQTLEVKQMAKAGYLTGAKLDGEFTSKSTLKDMGYLGESGAIEVKVGNETKTVEVSQSTTVEDFVKSLNEAGVAASFDSTNSRFFISSSSTGESNNFSISAGNTSGANALTKLGLLNKSDLEKQTSSVIGDDFTSSVAEIEATVSDGKLTALSYDYGKTYTKVSDAVKALSDAYKTLANSEASEAAQKTAKETIEANKAYRNLIGLSDEDLANTTDTASVISSAMQKINMAVSYVAGQNKITATNKNEDSVTVPDAAQAGLTYSFYDDDFGGIKLEGQDAEIILNGATFTSSKNNITVNGLTIEALGETTDPISITTSTDTSGLYDKIKDFLNSYNSVINEMMKLYNADSAKDYEPLSEDEKSQMSDKEIEKWEQKIKDALLRRDNTLGSLISSMTTSMMGTIKVNGEDVSWGTFGVGTLGYFNSEKHENYAYHIDGDSEDSKTSGKTDKLQAALAEDPDKVISFMKGMITNLYNAVDGKMKSTAVSSVYKVYNDKEMASEYSNYSDLIKTWTNRVTDLEDSYYKKFAAMESALATLQGNSSSLSSLLG